MKTVCIYHSIDLDGWMSAAIVKHWSNQPAKEGEHICGIFDFIGYNYGQPIPDLSEYDKVIMVDISFPKGDMEKLFDKLESNFIWNDHHKSAINMMFLEGDRSIHPLGLQQTDYAACELTWQYFFPNETMPEIVRLLGRYDCFGHKGTNEEQIVLEFQYGARSIISNYEEACNHLLAELNPLQGYNVISNILGYGQSIYQYLCTEAKQSYKNGFEITFKKPIQESGDLLNNTPSMYKFICINKERFNPINFGIDYHKDGYDGCACFHRTNDGKWAFSLYNDNGLVDCSVIAKRYGGGGHKGAAGFVTNDIKTILK